jgi:hypothetical protein
MEDLVPLKEVARNTRITLRWQVGKGRPMKEAFENL